ncbi:hypothetical protein QTI66_39030 [Variovorax sp. J22R133]|uniref:hypothetical protein n=1 Tax=Variovorax brevis TaxID=3053503 RepID=UPI002574EA3F|nr:hypothetical protein [Variovorax sp. J22R133]MDM0118069.1 hypothetical protein [Variovorax sp. J22R133]
MMASDSGRKTPPEAIGLHRKAGCDNAIESSRPRFGRFGHQIHALPDAFERLSDGMALHINGKVWRVVTGKATRPSTPAFVARR